MQSFTFNPDAVFQSQGLGFQNTVLETVQADAWTGNRSAPREAVVNLYQAHDLMIDNYPCSQQAINVTARRSNHLIPFLPAENGNPFSVGFFQRLN
jgi:hypothetical protein